MLRPMDSESFVTILFTAAVDARRRRRRRAPARTSRRCARVVAEHGGREVKSTGDGLMVAFASAVAARALRRRACSARRRGDALELRIGIDAGEPRRDGDDLYGTPVIVAERLCDAAGRGRDPRLRRRRARSPAARRRAVRPPARCGCAGVAERVAARAGAAGGDEAAPAARPRRARDDHRRDRRRPAAAAHRLPRDPRRRARHHASSARRPTAAPRSTSCARAPARRRADGHPHARARRPRRRPSRSSPTPSCATAVVMLTTFDVDEYVYEALRDRRERLPAQGRARRTGCSTPCASPPRATR